MKTILRRLSSTAAVLTALLAAPAALAVPTISITAPANGAALGTVSSPTGVTISATATATVGTSIVSVEFRVNGVSIGVVAANTSPSLNWAPTAAGTYTLTAIATDSGSVGNTATSASVIVTVTAARVVTLVAPATGTAVPTGSTFFIRSTAAMTDVVVSKMEFSVNGTIVGTVNSAPYNLDHTTTLAAGTYAVFARATLSDNTTTIDSASANLNVVAKTGAAPSVTINSPSTNSFVAVGQAVTVTAIASDDGFISTSSGGGVTFYADGEPIATDLTAPYSVTWTPIAAKAHSLRALAVDDKGNQTLSTTVTVTAVAAMPTVSLSAPTNGSTSAVSTAITSTASATASTGKTITQVAFFQNNTAIGAAVTTAPYTVNYTPTAAGSYAFTAQVTDSAGITVTSAASNVTVTAAQPTVSLTAPTLGSTATVGSNVTVTATATAGTGNTVAQVQFLAGATIIGTVTTAPYTITWVPTATGNSSLTARVLDSGGNTVTSNAVTVTVSSAPSVSITAPANNSPATVGTAVTVTATGSASPGATITNISFSAGGTAIGAAVTSAPYQVAWTPSAAGTTSLTATITDSAGQTTTSSAVSAIVANSQPTVSLSAPSAGAVVTLGSNVTLTATAAAGSGATIAQVQFLVGAVIVGTDTTTPYTLTWVPTTAGNQSITARVLDTNNNTVTSTAITITAAATTSVAITAPAANSTATAGTSTTITASATPTLGATLTSVTFFATPSGGAAAQIGAAVTTAPYTIAWTPSVAGAYSLTAVALDSTGTSVTSAAVSVTVANSQPTVSLTAPSAGTVATVGSNVTLTATAAAGSGATVAQVQFLVGAVIVGTDTTAPYTLTWVPTTAGNQVITARVIDMNNNTVTSTAVTITATATTAVAITAPTNNATATVGTATTIIASATPTLGATITSITFFATPPSGAAAQVGVAVTTAPYLVAWTPSVAGAHTLTAVALDSTGSSVTSSAVAVTVNNSAPTIALTAPLPGAVVTAGSNVTLTANAVAGSGGATVSQVQFLAGTSVVATLAGTPGSAIYTFATWVPASAGNFSLTARVTDSNGNSTTSTAVSVTATSSTPTTALTSPASGANIGLGAATTLTATATAGCGATVARVDFLAGTTTVGTALVPAGGSYSFSWTPSTAGITSLTSRVTDSNGAIATSAAVNVNVIGPSVVVTSPSNTLVLTTNASVSLTATATAVAPATVSRVDYFAGATLVGSATVAPYTVTWTASPAGPVSLTARVVDSNGVSVTSAAVSVTVSSFPPTVTLTGPASGASVGLGTATTLTATAAATGGATVSRVDFLAGTTTVGTALVPAGGSYSISWTPSVSGITALSARVTDSNGIAVTSAAVNVNVVGPTITLTAPANASVLTSNSAVSLTATAAAVAPATVSRVDYFAGPTFIGSATAGPTFPFTWTASPTGNVSLTARVVDSNGITVTSAPVTVTVNLATATTVALTSPIAGASLPLNTATTLTATASASGGATVTRVDFFAGPTTVGTALVAAGGSYSVSWTPTVSGVFSLTARVTDSAGAIISSSPISVTVSTTTGSSVALSMLPAITAIPVNSSRVLTASATSAAGIASVEFYYVSGGLSTLIGSDTVPPYTIVFTAPNEPGARALRARAIESTGGAITSTDLPISITGQIGDAPVAGILTPTSGTFIAANTTVTITGTATDVDGAIAGVQVFVNGSSTGLANGGVATQSGAAWSIVWTPTTTGTSSISAIATDTTGNAVAAPVVGVNVTDGTSPAISISLSPRTAATAASATLPSGAVRNFVADATASSGRAVVRVEFFVDGTKVGEDTSAPYTLRYVAPALATGESSRTYVLSARATDNAGSARDAQLPLLVVSPIGAPPSVGLLTPASGASTFPGTVVSLAATAASLGGTIASVQFYVNGSPALVNNGNGVIAAPYVSTFTPTAAGTYVIDAIATDDRGNMAVSNAATITAAFSVPSIAITVPNPNSTARALPNVPITLTAAATVQVGAGASVLLVEFLLDGVQIGARTTASNAALGTYSFNWIPLTSQLGPHVITARVTDTNSQSATSAPVNLNVATAVGTPPAITISTTPIPGLGLQTLSQVNFLANAFANGVNTTITNVEFFLNDLSIGLASREQATNLFRLAYDFSRIDFASAPVNPNNPAQYLLPLYAIARDSNNNQTVSATSNLSINAATSAVPAITLTSLTPTTVTQATQVFILPTFGDSDGTVTQIQLYANGVAVQTLGNPVSNQSLFTYNAGTPGRFNLFAVATDDTGNTAISSPAIVVQVNAVNAPDTTLTRPATASSTTTVNAPVFLEGTARATGTTLIPTLAFIATGSSGTRQQINGARVGTTTTYRAIWNPTTADVYSLVTQATVAGVQSTSTISRNVVVNELIGIAPTISISVPGTVTTVSAANLTATAADSDGSVIGVEFFVNRNTIGQAERDQLTNTWRLSTSFVGLPPGSTEVVARATDNSGNVAASGTSFINLVAASSIAPSITLTPSTTNAAFNRQVQLRANARDSDGTVTSVQYFANGTSLGSTGNSGTSFQVSWTPNASGTFSVYGVATDNTGNLIVSPTVQIVVRRNNPVLEDAAFILQTYQDIANTTNINPLVFDDLDTRLSSGALTRADFVASLVIDPAFVAPVNTLATYYVLMGQWPTPANYASVLNTTRNNGLAGAVGGPGQGQGTILGSNEYFAKFGVIPTNQLLDSPISVLPAELFLNRLHESAGLPPPTALNRVQFRSFNQVNLAQGRGYANVGLQTALAEFVTNTNSTNTALFKRARAAALFYQLARPPVTMTVDEITTKVNALALLVDDKAVVDAVLRDVLYAYRYVTINKHPASLTVSPRSGAIFTVEAIGSPPLAYQWLLNGSPVPGATNSFLSLTNVSTSNVGAYTVAITSTAATATSDPATLTLSAIPTRLANISTRGVTSGGANTLIGGFVVTGTAAQTRQVLIRVVGPTLGDAPFNVAGTLANPSLELFAGTNRNPVLANDNWGAQAAGPAQVTLIQQAAARAAAFALPLTSSDAAVLATLAPGPYTVQATIPAATPTATGVVLIEVYDVTQGGVAGPKAANVSTRGFVGTGTNSLIAGFVVSGGVSRRVLIRGAGPALAAFGVPGVLADPQLTLAVQATGRTIRTNDNWAAGVDASVIATAAAAAGAFPFASNSRDAAMIVMLEPGAYTVQLTGVGNTTGVGIVEVYDVDP